MSDLIIAKPTDLTDAELDTVAAGRNSLVSTNISINVPVNTSVIVQDAIALNVLSPGAAANALNFGFSLQSSV